MYKFIDNLIKELSNSKAIIGGSAFSLSSDVNNKAFSKTLSIAIQKLDKVLGKFEKLMTFSDE